MSATREAMSHAVLGWVKPELDESLRQVRNEIEAYVEDQADSSRMRFCVGYLHQVQGTLRMVELYAPAMVAEEMEALAQALQDGRVDNPEEACATLMRGVVLLPDYLERLQDGHRDIPIVLLPLLNEIRAARGAAGLNEAMLFPQGVNPEDAPSEEEIDHARGSLSGRNRELLDTVGGVVKEELLRVKDALDLYLRTNDDAVNLHSQVKELGNVADTLGMMGLGVARGVVLQQRDILREVAEGKRAANEDTLLDIAGALLYVDASLDDQVARLGHVGPAGLDSGNVTDAQRTIEVLAQEAINNFAAAREKFVAFIETNWSHAELVDVPRLLGDVSGALRILELDEAADYLIGVQRYVGNELIGKQRIPGGQQLDTLADAMASLEYYLEALKERRPNRQEILEITRTSLENLRYWPLPEEVAASVVEVSMPVVVPAPVAVDASEPVAPMEATPPAANPFDPVGFEEEAAVPLEFAAGDLASLDATTEAPSPLELVPEVDSVPEHDPLADSGLEVEEVALEIEEVVLDAPASESLPPTLAPTLGGVDGFDGEAGDIDDEIREVFLEEFDEEIDNLGQLLPAWKAAPEDLERLRPIRRVFHTLKGSGRLVGAKTLGEFSWKVENMLNRVLDGSRPPSEAVAALLGHAHAVLPQLNAALRGTAAITADLEGIKDIAERIAAGEDSYYQPGLRSIPEDAAVAAFVEATPPASAEIEVEDGTPAALDVVLREILETEVDNHLQTVHAWLDQARQAPTAVDDALLRAVHTMNGAFAMADVPEITGVTHPGEQYIKRLLAAGTPVPAEGVAAIGEMAQAIRRTIQLLQGENPRIPFFTALIAQLSALRDCLPDVRMPVQLVGEGVPAALETEVHAGEGMHEPQDIELAALDLSDYLSPTVAATSAAVDTIADAGFAMPADTTEEEAPLVASEPRPASDEVTYFEVEYTFTPRMPEEEAPAPIDTLQEAEVAGGDAVATQTGDAEASMEVASLELEAIEAVADEPSAEQDESQPSPLVSETVAEPSLPDMAASGPADTVDVLIEEASADAIDAMASSDEVAAWDELPDEAEVAVPVAAVGGLELEPTSTDAPAEEGLAAAVSETADVVEVEVEAEAEAEPAMPSSDTVDVAGLDEDTVMVEEIGAESSGEPEAMATEEEPAATQDEQQAEPEAGFEPVVAAQEPVTEAESVAVEEPAFDEEPAPDVFEAVDALEDQPEPAAADEALSLQGLDLDLVDIFAEEGNDLLDHSDGLLAALRETPDDRSLVTGLQRDLHTIKGGARMAGIHSIGDLGHAVESMLESIMADRIALDDRALLLLERGFDSLHAMVGKVSKHQVAVIPDGLLAEINAHARGLDAPAIDNKQGKSTQDTAAVVDLAPLSAPVETEFAVEDEFFPKGQQEQVRVRSDLLDRLVNHAGEVAIYRARLEQQLGAFRGAMAELDRTNTRLHDQLRRLDLETEAQIVARYQREHEKQDPTFDPLELDRFSTLQQLSRALAESAADLTGLQGVLDDLARQYDGLLHQQSRVSSELQDGLMRARMVPFEGIVPRLRRVLRQAASDTGKQAKLQLSGTHGEMDRNVLERMTAPLEHLMRNSVAHGLESPKQRRAAGKQAEGTVHVALRREGSEMVLEVSDDGAGLNRAAIRKRAEQRGLLAAGATIADADLDRLILESGFSTYDGVSQLAGRGVGMDVVYNEVRQLGGTLDIVSMPGQGARFILRLPQTLAVTQAVFVQIGDTQFAVPVAAVSGIGRISRERFEAEGGVYHYSGEDYTLHNLGTLVGHAPARAEGQPQVPLLLVRAGELRAAVAVDMVLGNREIVVKPVGPQIASIPGIYGATITGDGSIVVILDAAPLVRRHLAQPQAAAPTVSSLQQRTAPLVMVVDDSLTMRKVTSRVLERHNLEVSSARDGVEALERLEERIPDLMLLDIEMPRMDGYELATAMRADPRFRDIPIVMITSRTGDKHRQRAFDIGVQRYMGKPYQELDLMRNVYDLLGIARVRE